MRSFKKFSVCGFTALLFALTVQAGLLPTHVSVQKEGDYYRYSYCVILESDSVLKQGDYFTIYDFAGLVPGQTTQQPSDFGFSSANSGATPNRVTPDDDPNIPNLTWTYDGSAVLSGFQHLGKFSALSIYGKQTDDAFTGQTHREVDGHLNNNITDTRVPVPCTPPEVPEPSTIALLLAGIPIAMGIKALRRKN